MLGGRNLLEDSPGLVYLGPDGGGGEFCCIGRAAQQIAELVPEENRFERQGRLSALVAVDISVQAGDRFIENGFIVEFFETFGELTGDGEFCFQPFGGAEVSQESILERCFLLLINNGLGLLGGDLEMSVFLHFLFCDFPPFFPILGNDVWHEQLLDLVDRRFSAVALEHQFDQFEMMEGGHFTKLCEFGKFARKNMAVREGFERIGRKSEVH